MPPRIAAIAVVLTLAATACTGKTAIDRGTPSPSPSAHPGLFALHARASVVQTTGRVTGLGSMRLSGSFLIAATTETRDGKKHRLLVDGGVVTITGVELGLIGRSLTITPATIDAIGDTIPPKSRWKTADRSTAFPRLLLGTPVEITGDHVLVDDRTVRGMQRIHLPSGDAVLYGRATLTRVTSRFRVEEDLSRRAPRAGFATPTFFSWKGSGTVTIPGRSISGSPLTLIATTLKTTFVRRGGAFDIEGGGEATQVAVDGKPQLRTKLDVTITTPDRALYPGISEQLTWVMEVSAPWEAIITGIRAVNAAAKWSRLHFDPPPPLDAPGGRSLADAQLRCVAGPSAFAEFYLCSQIGPGKGAEAPVVFHVPFFQATGHYNAIFEIRGNFPTVRVSVPMDVKRQ